MQAQLVKALCEALNLRPRVKNGVRPQMNEWLRIVGLSATNIRHIQLLGYHDVMSLVQLPENEVGSYSDFYWYF